MYQMFCLAAEVAVSIDDARHYLLGAVAIRNRDQVVVKAPNGPAYIKCSSAHAEARVLRKAGQEAILYVARVSKKTGFFTLGRPCEKCFSLMRNQNVKRCYYTISKTEYGIITFKNDSVVEEIKLLKKIGSIKFISNFTKKKRQVQKSSAGSGTPSR